MSKTKEEYERLQRDLAEKQRAVQNLQQQKTVLESQSRSLQELAQINSQIQSLRGEIDGLQPQYNRLQNEYNKSVSQNQGLNYQINNINQHINQSSTNKNKYDDSFSSLESILNKYSEFAGQKIDNLKMVVQKNPEPLNSTALKDACEKQSREAFDELLKKISDINATDSQGMTLLLYSLKYGFWYGVDKSLEHGADINLTDEYGCNALHYACTMPHLNSITKIIERSQDVNVRVPQSNDTVLHSILKNVGIDKIWSNELPLLVNTRQEGDTLVITENLFFTGNFMVAGNVTIGDFGGIRHDGFTINQKKALTICKALKDKGADFAIKDNLGLSPYFYICANQQRYLIDQLKKEGIIDVEKLDQTGFQGAAGYLLLNDQANLKNFINKHPNSLKSVDANGESLLHYAVQLRNLSLMSLLVDCGADINLRNNSGDTVLNFVTRCAWQEGVTWLIEHGAFVNIPDKNGIYPIHIAAAGGNNEIIKLLINKNIKIGNAVSLKMIAANKIVDADIAYENKIPSEIIDDLTKYNSLNQKTNDTNKVTPLYLASQEGKLETVKLLANLGANLNASREDNVSPLHVAIQKGHVEVSKELIAKNANVNTATTTDKLENETPLHTAARQQSTAAIVKLLIDKGADINAINFSKLTPMAIAIITNNIEAAKVLIDKEPDVNKTNTEGLSAWHYAAYAGAKDIAQYLRVKIKDIDQKTTSKISDTALMLAVEQQQQEMVNWLLNIGANLNVTKKDNGYTALMLAVSAKNVKIAELLLTKGADTNINNSLGYHPIHLAALEQDIAMINLLAKHCNIDQKSNNIEQITALCVATEEGKLESIKALIKLGADLNAPRASNNTLPLHIAFSKNYISIAKELIIAGAKIGNLNTNGETELHMAARIKDGVSIIEILINKGLDINARNMGGGTPILVAAYNNNKNSVDLLLKSNANIDILDNHGRHVWHYAAVSGSLEVMEVIRAKVPVDVKTKNTEQHTALWLAADQGKLELVNWLINLGADVNASQLSDGKTALHTAILNKHSSVAKLLIEKSVDINKGDKDLATPLYYSVQSTDYDSNQLTKYLIDNGANVHSSILSINGYTSLHMASLFGNIEAVRMLIKAGADVNAVDVRGYTPIFSAIWEWKHENASYECKLNVTKYLIAGGARLNQIGKEGETIFELAKKYLPEAIEWLEHPERLPSIAELEVSMCKEIDASAKKVFNKDTQSHSAAQFNSKTESTNINNANASGDDRNLADNGHEPHYWYSISDGSRLQWSVRELLHYNKTPRPGEEFTALRENTDRVLVADPYYINNFKGYLSDDIAKVSAIASSHSWSQMPKFIIIPLLSGSHWSVVKVNIDYNLNKATIELNDPYGQDLNGKSRFSSNTKTIIQEAVKDNVQTLIRKESGNASFNYTNEIDISENSVDQQGIGHNGWDCGPITFSNIMDYVEFISGITRALTFSVPAYNNECHNEIISQIRKDDINTYKAIASSDGAGTSVNQSKVNYAKDQIKNTKEFITKKAKDLSSDIADKINNLDDNYTGILIDALEGYRFWKNIDPKLPYSLEEMSYAYSAVEAEVLGRSHFDY